MSDGTKVEKGGNETARAMRAFVALLTSDATADWALTAPDSSGIATLTVDGEQTTGNLWALLAEIEG